MSDEAVRSEAVRSEAVSRRGPHPPARPSIGSVVSWRFAGHLAEMVLAMIVGMVALGLLLGAVGEPPGYHASPMYQYGLMCAAMAVPMVAWMRVRGHSWSDGAQMTAAMTVPVLVLVAPAELGLTVPGLTGGSLMVVTHMAMVVAMGVWLALRWIGRGHRGHR